MELNVAFIEDIKHARKINRTGAYNVLMSLGATHAAFGTEILEGKVSVRRHELNFQGEYVRFDECLAMAEELDIRAYDLLDTIMDRYVRRRRGR